MQDKFYCPKHLRAQLEASSSRKFLDFAPTRRRLINTWWRHLQNKTSAENTFTLDGIDFETAQELCLPFKTGAELWVDHFPQRKPRQPKQLSEEDSDSPDWLPDAAWYDRVDREAREAREGPPVKKQRKKPAQKRAK